MNLILFVASLNIVIIELRKAINKDKYIYKAIDMFLENFGYIENSILNLVYSKEFIVI